MCYEAGASQQVARDLVDAPKMRQSNLYAVVRSPFRHSTLIGHSSLGIAHSLLIRLFRIIRNQTVHAE